MLIKLLFKGIAYNQYNTKSWLLLTRMQSDLLRFIGRQHAPVMSVMSKYAAMNTEMTQHQAVSGLGLDYKDMIHRYHSTARKMAPWSQGVSLHCHH